MGRWAISGAVFAAILISSAGCFFAGVYSKQDYGPPPAYQIGQDISVEDLIKTFGAPDEQVQSGDAKIFIYRRIEGMQVLGVYSEVKKSDLVCIARGDRIIRTVQVPKGESLTILGVLSAPVLGPGVVKEE
jgi:hypothetical protein